MNHKINDTVTTRYSKTGTIISINGPMVTITYKVQCGKYTFNRFETIHHTKVFAV